MLDFKHTFVKRFRRDENAATAIEYGLIAAIIAIGIIVALTAVGTELDTLFSGIGNSFATILAG